MGKDAKLLVIDAGTTSTRAMLFDAQGHCHGAHQRAIRQSYPADGWVEQDAAEIWASTLACAQAMVAQAGGAAHICAIGITNQRETVIFWDRNSGEPLAPAIVWQDRRTADACNALRDAGQEAAVQAKTGLLLDPYFSASKIGWALQNWPQLRAAGDRLAVGTVESFLLHRLTGGAHLSDASNASRTMLMDIYNMGWDAGLCALFDVPTSILPQIVDCHGPIGRSLPAWFGAPIAICGAAGDQQSATIGQGCIHPGDTKATYGTGAFILTSTGQAAPRSQHRLLTTILYAAGGQRHYALEGSVFVAGALIQWLRDSLHLLGNAAESEGLARSVADNGGVVCIPALSGLGAPHWRSDARAMLSGMSFATGRAHIIRAGLEAMAHQTQDLAAAFAGDGAPWQRLQIDGGMSANDWMAQDLADILALPVERPDFVETTALGAAMLAATGAGLYPDLPSATAAMQGERRRFVAQMDDATRTRRIDQWQRAMTRVLG
ncbi:MAG: glycerol kinase [Sphingomonadaceae bacterium]|nr:glycerol kinase [Sphingomonadaceae bacterium]